MDVDSGQLLVRLRVSRRSSWADHRDVVSCAPESGSFHSDASVGWDRQVLDKNEDACTTSHGNVAILPASAWFLLPSEIERPVYP